jgi:predicted ATP-grasp superfamily ATP-dependent carboligase
MKVFLFDYRSRHALAIIYSLRRYGYQVVVGTGKIPSYHFGATEFLRWDGSVDSLVPLLLQHGIQIVMPISIEAFRFCSQEKARLSVHGIKLLVSDLSTWLRFYNKAQTYEAAAGYGIPVPRTIAISPGNYRDQIARADLSFKLVIKGAEEGGARFVRYAHSIRDCEEIFRDFLRQDPDVFHKGVLAQEYIEGTGCAYFCLADQGRILAEFGHRRIHQSPPTGGVSTCCASFRNERMFEQGRTLVRKERYSGPCMIEFKHDRQKERFVLIEVNPKFWGSSLLPILCGVNFPVLYVRHLLGESLGPSTIEDKTLQFVIPDLARATRHPACLSGFLKMLFHSGVNKDIAYFGLIPYLSYYVRR